MNNGATPSYDVLIMGAGFAGLCQARHLRLKAPGLRVGMIDPKGLDASQRDLKVGESLVEISAMFLYRELELQEYLIENHPPKFGLNFHWPKKVGETSHLDDYYHVWTNGNPDLPSYQLNRARFEADLLRMNIEMGVDFIQGKVVDTTITPGQALNYVRVKTVDGEIDLAAHHLVDAAGRKFLLGKKLDNLVQDPADLAGLESGSAWLRVTGVDRDLFQRRREETNGAASHWYGTNHWFGHGHWVWMIPIETETRTLSIGVVHHREVIANRSVNTREKFLDFLEANHGIVHDMVQSGEILDFKYLPKIAHRSRTMLSEDQWYVIGEAANMFDAFYSTGLVLAAQNIEGVTEVIRAKSAGEADAEEKRAIYDAFILRASDTYNQVYRDHAKHLGDASVMSWRIYMEMIFWFGILVPMFTGKWHLEKDFIRQFFKITDSFFLSKNSFVRAFYDELTRVQASGINIGMMDYTRADQLINGYKPTKLWESFRENTIYEKRRLNALKGIKSSIFYLGVLYARLRIKRSGILGLFEPQTMRHLASLSCWTVYTAMGEWMHKREVRGRPFNTRIEEQKSDFRENYHFEPRLAPWEKSTEEDSDAILETVPRDEVVLPIAT